MATEEVSIRELRNHGGEVVDRVRRGHRAIITRAGRPVAEPRPLGRPALATAVLIERRRGLPAMDPQALRADLDELVDGSL